MQITILEAKVGKVPLYIYLRFIHDIYMKKKVNHKEYLHKIEADFVFDTMLDVVRETLTKIESINNL